MTEDERIIEMLFERSEQGIRELDIKYGKICRDLSYRIVGSRQDAEECVNDAYLGAWNAIPPERPDPLLTYILKIVRNISLKVYRRNGAASEAAATRLLWTRSRLALQIQKPWKPSSKRENWLMSSKASWIRRPLKIALSSCAAIGLPTAIRI